MINLSGLGLLAPLLILIAVSVLLYRMREKRRRHSIILLNFVLLILGALCVLSGFYANIYYDGLTSGIMLLLGIASIMIVISIGGKMPLAGMIALGIGVIFGYMGSVGIKYKIDLFFELIGKNVPEFYIGAGLAVFYFFIAYVVLRFIQDWLVAFACLFDTQIITILVCTFTLIQAVALIAGTSLQPLLSQIVSGVR